MAWKQPISSCTTSSSICQSLASNLLLIIFFHYFFGPLRGLSGAWTAATPIVLAATAFVLFSLFPSSILRMCCVVAYRYYFFL
ncbi:hypothetical protein GGR53DRAFT_503309 [Hypoxylon sp. FL1150]|nr:hypothetical protein GGR53DRAFT_503309 [Hypoxylon sp. FL1150]